MELGMRVVIWKYGVLYFGLLMGGFMAIQVWFIDDWANHGILSNALKLFLGGPVMGLIWGSLMWLVMTNLRSYRVRRGLCPCCGRNPHAAPDRCPECGTVPPVAPTK